MNSAGSTILQRRCLTDVLLLRIFLPYIFIQSAQGEITQTSISKSSEVIRLEDMTGAKELQVPPIKHGMGIFLPPLFEHWSLITLQSHF